MTALRHVRHDDGPDRAHVALKALLRIADAWHLSNAESAALADMSESTWKRARRPGATVSLGQDQLLRVSALVGIYKALQLYWGEALADRWPTRPNDGPLFDGARPVDTMIRGGLPHLLQVRAYLDALRGGA